MKKRQRLEKKTRLDKIVSKLVEQETKLKGLPPLTPLEKAKFDSSIAIEHLYYSSKLEGTHLTEKQIEKAVHGEDASAAKK